MGYVWLVYALIVSCSWDTTQGMCGSPQYFEIGESGTLKCHFEENFYAVVWHNSEDLHERQSLCVIFDGVKEGQGCLSGEFDIPTDGSLIINNVSLEHDHNFTVHVFYSQDAEPVSIQVEVVVIVKPSMSLPGIEDCEEEGTTCFMQLSSASTVSCYVSGARPAVSLTWASRTGRGDMRILFQTSVKQDGALFTSLATTQDFFSYSSLLALLVCKAVTPPGLLSENETVIFIENSDNVVLTLDPIVKYIERDHRLELICSNMDPSLIVWKRADRRDGHFHVLFYAAVFELDVPRTYSDEYVLKSNGTLVVPRVEAKHEGLYGCTVENNDVGNTSLFDIRVYVPAYPVVYGCTQHQYCVLEVQAEGNITCSVTGIRPQVSLTWKILDERDSSSIHFSETHVTSNSHEDVFDVHITSKFQIKDTAANRLPLECRIAGSATGILTSGAKFDLFILKDQPVTVSPPPSATHNIHAAIWIAVALLCVLTSIILCLCVKRHFQWC